MNENLIRQLAYKVLLKTGTPTGSDEWQQVFAELIVKECAEIAKHNVMNISTYADAEFVEKQVKQHFGVEE